MPFSFDHSRATACERLGQRAGLERGGHRRLDAAAGLRQAVARELLGVVEVPVAIGVAVAGLLRRLELGDDPDQALGDGVVDLAGHPLPARPGCPPRAPGSAAGRGGRRSRSSAASSLASAWRRSSFCSVIFSPMIEPAPMTTVWIADDHEVEGPGRRRLREPGDQGVHQDRRRDDAEERQRQRPQDRGVEEAADHEDEEQRLSQHQDRGEDQEPDEEHAHAEAMCPAAAAAAG